MIGFHWAEHSPRTELGRVGRSVFQLSVIGQLHAVDQYDPVRFGGQQSLHFRLQRIERARIVALVRGREQRC